MLLEIVIGPQGICQDHILLAARASHSFAPQVQRGGVGGELSSPGSASATKSDRGRWRRRIAGQ
jgi:hypothetical protein